MNRVYLRGDSPAAKHFAPVYENTLSDESRTTPAIDPISLFSIGSTVRLKRNHTGPNMVIMSINRSDNTATCVWPDMLSGKHYSSKFTLEALQLVSSWIISILRSLQKFRHAQDGRITIRLWELNGIDCVTISFQKNVCTIPIYTYSANISECTSLT